MKKIYVFLALIIFSLNAYASDEVVVKCLEDYEYDKSFKSLVLENSVAENHTFNKNDIIESEVIEQVEAKRGKRQGYIIIKPLYIEKEGTSSPIGDKNLYAKVVGYSKKDWKEIGEKAGLSAGLATGSHFIPGFSQAFYFAKGVIRPYENKSRIRSGFKEIYENSPFVYMQKGQEFNPKKDDLLLLKFYITYD